LSTMTRTWRKCSPSISTRKDTQFTSPTQQKQAWTESQMVGSY
jgi:hypothetical protein